MYASTSQVVKVAWDKIHNTYNLIYLDQVNYLQNIWLCSWKRRFVICYTDQMMHFDNIVISKIEDSHVALKR
jgi:hypothetical protein